MFIKLGNRVSLTEKTIATNAISGLSCHASKFLSATKHTGADMMVTNDV